MTEAYLAIDNLISRSKIGGKCTIADLIVNGMKFGESQTGQSALIVETSLGETAGLGAVLGVGFNGLSVEPGPQ